MTIVPQGHAASNIPVHYLNIALSHTCTGINICIMYTTVFAMFKHIVVMKFKFGVWA